ncbi:MAG: CRTAC1 family protein, partial [Terriglobales bacterium]
LGDGRFQETTSSLGKGFSRARVARGAAYADFDNDGDLDLLVTTNGGPAYLFRNDGSLNHSLRIRLRGTRSNRNGLGAVVFVRSGDAKQEQVLRSGSSYLSQSELVLTFGLGGRSQADQVEVRWPSGQIDWIKTVAAVQTVTVEEGKGIVVARPFTPRR